MMALLLLLHSTWSLDNLANGSLFLQKATCTVAEHVAGNLL